MLMQCPECGERFSRALIQFKPVISSGEVHLYKDGGIAVNYEGHRGTMTPGQLENDLFELEEDIIIKCPSCQTPFLPKELELFYQCYYTRCPSESKNKDDFVICKYNHGVIICPDCIKTNKTLKSFCKRECKFFSECKAKEILEAK